MNNMDLARIWAAQDRPAGKGHNLSFSGPVLKSYATAIAQLVVDDGEACGAVLNATKYSLTTSRHQNYARHALFRARVPYVELDGIPRGEPELIPAHNTKDWARNQVRRLLAACAGRPGDEVKKATEYAERLAAWFGLGKVV